MRRAGVGAGVGVVILLAAAGCEASPFPPPPAPSGIPFGGERASITPRDVAAARQGMAGGLVEPGWLPDGFELMFVGYYGPLEQAADLNYDDGEHYLHIWQAHRGPGELGPKEPFDYGDRSPIGHQVEWHANPLDQMGWEGVVEYSARMPDGRSVTVDSDLDPEVMKRVLESLYVRAAPGET